MVKQFVRRSSYCSCKIRPESDEQDYRFFVDDDGFEVNGGCPCGIYKHHIHCKKCGGVTQVG